MDQVEAIIRSQEAKRKLFIMEEQNSSDGDDNVYPDEFLCPICYDLMKPPDKKPLTIFPCGHTCCAECYKEQAKINDKCPVCNTRCRSTATNFALMNLIVSGVTVNQHEDYSECLRAAADKLSIVKGQYDVNQSQLDSARGKCKTARIVLEHIKEEYEFVKKKYEDQLAKVESLESKIKVMEDENSKLKSVIEPLVQDIQKYQLLIQSSK